MPESEVSLMRVRSTVTLSGVTKLKITSQCRKRQVRGASTKVLAFFMIERIKEDDGKVSAGS